MIKKFLSFLVIAVVIYNVTGSATVRWDPGDDSVLSAYEIKLIRDVSLEEFNFGVNGTTTTITIPKRKSGKYEVKIRAVKENNGLKSDWCSSLDPTRSLLKDGTPGAWKLFWKPGSILGPIIITPSSFLWFDGAMSAEYINWDRS